MRPVPRPRAPSNGASLPGATSIRLLTEGLWFQSDLRSHLNQALARPPLLNFTSFTESPADLRLAPRAASRYGPSVPCSPPPASNPQSPSLRQSSTPASRSLRRTRCHIAPTTRSASPRRLIDTCSFTSSQLLSASHQRSNPALAPSPKSSAPFNSHRCLAVRAASFWSLYLQRPHNGHQTTLIVRALKIQPKDL